MLAKPSTRNLAPGLQPSTMEFKKMPSPAHGLNESLGDALLRADGNDQMMPENPLNFSMDSARPLKAS